MNFLSYCIGSLLKLTFIPKVNDFCRLFLLLSMPLLWLTGCEEGSAKSFTSSSRSLKKEEIVGVSPPFDPSDLNEEEKEFFARLSTSRQIIFSNLNKEQRAYLMKLLRQYSADDAVWMAAENEVLTLPKKEQRLYFQLNIQDKLLFLALSEAQTLKALELADSLSNHEAILKIVQNELKTYPEPLQRFASTLNNTQLALLLALSEKAQNQLAQDLTINGKEELLQVAKKRDADRLPQEQLDFMNQLTSENQILFLLLSPEKRSLALLLFKKIDPVIALEYAFFADP